MIFLTFFVKWTLQTNKKKMFEESAISALRKLKSFVLYLNNNTIYINFFWRNGVRTVLRGKKNELLNKVYIYFYINFCLTVMLMLYNKIMIYNIIIFNN